MSVRKRWDMPSDVWSQIVKNGLQKVYEARPPYQKNDYIGWITQAKQETTRTKRIDQMIDELKDGDVYMNMPWGKSAAKKPKTNPPKSFNEFAGSSGSLLKDITIQLNKNLMKINPDYKTKAAWGGWVYRYEDNKFSCMIVHYKDHVKLMIWRGIKLDDPKKLLKGNGVNTRHLVINKIQDINYGYMSKLLLQQKKLYDSGLNDEG